MCRERLRAKRERKRERERLASCVASSRKPFLRSVRKGRRLRRRADGDAPARCPRCSALYISLYERHTAEAFDASVTHGTLWESRCLESVHSLFRESGVRRDAFPRTCTDLSKLSPKGKDPYRYSQNVCAGRRLGDGTPSCSRSASARTLGRPFRSVSPPTVSIHTSVLSMSFGLWKSVSIVRHGHLCFFVV